jgi:hypothetical protein
MLRLPLRLKREAMRWAKQDGVSLHYFIALAVAEKVAQCERRRVTSATFISDPEPKQDDD